MNISMHNVTKVIRGKVEKNIISGGETYYTMKIKFINTQLSDFKSVHSEEDLFGKAEFETEILLFAKTPEALKMKVENIT